jgi:hypothetical protein
MLPPQEERLERAAESLRTRWGIHDQACPDVITMIFKLKYEGLITGYALVPDADLPEDEAEYDPHKRLLRIRESTFHAANDLYGRSTKNRARFTVAHEVGHIILGHERIRHRNISERKIERIVIQTRIDETEANRFASALLMPRHLVDLTSNPTIQELARKFQVSEAAAKIRLEELLRLRRREQRNKRPSPDVVRQFLLEAKSRGMKIVSLDDDDE